MELTLRLQAVEKAYRQLAKMLVKLHDAPLKKTIDEDDIIAYRDSTIKRFEMAYDITWKFLKLYFEETYAMSTNSPRSVFQICFKQELINEEEARCLFDMIDDRNLTAHTYNENLAIQVSSRVQHTPSSTIATFAAKNSAKTIVLSFSSKTKCQV